MDWGNDVGGIIDVKVTINRKELIRFIRSLGCFEYKSPTRVRHPHLSNACGFCSQQFHTFEDLRIHLNGPPCVTLYESIDDMFDDLNSVGETELEGQDLPESYRCCMHTSKSCMASGPCAHYLKSKGMV